MAHPPKPDPEPLPWRNPYSSLSFQGFWCRTAFKVIRTFAIRVKASLEPKEYDIQLVKVREHPTKVLEPPEQALDLVASSVPFPILFPGSNTVALERHHEL